MGPCMCVAGVAVLGMWWLVGNGASSWVRRWSAKARLRLRWRYRSWGWWWPTKTEAISPLSCCVIFFTFINLISSTSSLVSDEMNSTCP